MSLLVTSCTMGQQPGRLLNKGPQYLRTRTNASLFGQHRQSAVELLAASKAQFYNSKTSVPLDKQQDLAVTVGQHQRYSKGNNSSSKQKEPPRSKSEYDLTHSQLASVDDESDENNNDTSDDSISFSKAGVVENKAWLNLRDDSRTKHISNSEGATASVSVFNSSVIIENALNSGSDAAFSENSSVNHSSKPQPRLTILRDASATTLENEQIYENVSAVCMHRATTDEVDGKIIKKPVPLPRKSKEKPVPPPRKLSVRSPSDESTKDSNLSLSEVAISPLSVQSPSLSNRFLFQETPQLKTQTSLTSPETDPARKPSVVDSLTKQFTTLSATCPPPLPDKPHLASTSEKNPELKVTPGITGTYTATPVFIGKADTYSQSFHAKRVFITENCVSSISVTPKTHHSVLDAFYVSSDNIAINRSRKRCPDDSASARSVKRERRSIGSDTSYSKPGFMNSTASIFVSPERNNSSLAPKSEMSVESADQAACESEINATASMEAENVRGQDEWAREVTRSNSSLSGRMESQDASTPSASPTPHTLVPRSHSDISCCLESRHSRDSSLVSNHSRLSRASIGTDLENFFNQMGLEKSVLEPMNRLRELQAGEVFDSMSSFDSQDAVSIYSRSEQECSDSQSMDRSQQQTSVVERNARIIKWLCNVRKAKVQPQKPNSPATSKT